MIDESTFVLNFYIKLYTPFLKRTKIRYKNSALGDASVNISIKKGPKKTYILCPTLS